MGDPMTEGQAQTWKATPFVIERKEGRSAGTDFSVAGAVHAEGYVCVDGAGGGG